MFVKFLTSAIRISAIFLFGSTGEIITEKSGHLHLHLWFRRLHDLLQVFGIHYDF